MLLWRMPVLPHAHLPGLQDPSVSPSALTRAASSATHVIFSRLLPDADALDVALANDRDGPVLANLAGWVRVWAQSTSTYHGFARFCSCFLPTSWSSAATPPACSNLHSASPGTKVLVSVGGPGAGSDALSRLVLNAQSVGRFANASADYLQRQGLDGMELSWPELRAEQVGGGRVVRPGLGPGERAVFRVRMHIIRGSSTSPRPSCSRCCLRPAGPRRSPPSCRWCGRCRTRCAPGAGCCWAWRCRRGPCTWTCPGRAWAPGWTSSTST